MNDDYLWDGRGEPQPEVNGLEQLLEEFRWSGKQLLPQRPAQAGLWRGKRLWATAATAAVVALGIAWSVGRMAGPRQITSWQVSFGGKQPVALRAGQVVETGRSGATVRSDSVGEVELAPDSRLRVLAVQEARHNLALDHGTIHALIWAPPTKFIVDTPAAKTVDLGCQYTLSVAKNGDGFLQVEMGWVAFEWNKIESFIPAGAACKTRVGHGPETPYFLDAPASFTEALFEFDSTGHRQSLTALLAAARPRDALTLWHLLERTEGGERAAVFDRFAAMTTLSPGVTRQAILRGDRSSMDVAWDALKLGDTSWWRTWKRDW